MASMQDIPFDRATLAQQVYARLRQQILRGELRQGVRLSEQEISQSLGVSPTPVREALRLLNGDGIVEVHGRRGARVIQPSADSIRQCFAVRCGLERLAVREASRHLTAEDKERLLELAEATGGAAAQSREAFFAADHAFHGLITAKAGNIWLSNFLASLNDFLLVVRVPLLVARSADVEQTRQEHVAVARALSGDRVDDAERLIDQHIARVCEDVLRLAAQPSAGEEAAGKGEKGAASG